MESASRQLHLLWLVCWFLLEISQLMQVPVLAGKISVISVACPKSQLPQTLIVCLCASAHSLALRVALSMPTSPKTSTPVFTGLFIRICLSSNDIVLKSLSDRAKSTTPWSTRSVFSLQEWPVGIRRTLKITLDALRSNGFWKNCCPSLDSPTDEQLGRSLVQ